MDRENKILPDVRPPEPQESAEPKQITVPGVMGKPPVERRKKKRK